MARKKSGSYKIPRKKYLCNLKGFENLSSHIQNFESVLEAIQYSDNLKYQLGSFSLSLQSSLSLNNCEIVHVCFKELSSECFVCWKEVNNSNHQAQGETNSELDQEPKVVYSYGTYFLPFELLVFLSNKKHFCLVFDSMQTEKLNIRVFINPSSICNLLYPSQPYRINAQAQVRKVVRHFCGIHVEDFEKEFIEDEKCIEKIYKCIENSYKANVKEKICHPFLIPKLRLYQCQAVKWMLECETRSKNTIEDVNDIHVLYEELNLCNGSKIYYQKYCGVFLEKKFFPLPLCKGGILADEMGLGKTVEVFALILLHQRTPEKSAKPDVKNHGENSNGSSIFKDENICRDRENIPHNSENLLGLKRSFDSVDSCSDNEEMNPVSNTSISFECSCGFEKSDDDVVVCFKCGLAQHSECILFDPSDVCDPYICPYCLVDSSSEFIKSSSTLIVSPFSILHQWEQEVKKHIRPKKLKVFLYLGVEKHKFVDPRTLASYDIVLTSYEVLRRESTHVNVPHGENQRIFRTPKKFRALPSPLPAIEWWRICLDEAQMVERVSSKVAQVALNLNCINRWCVTGTPIQKSVEDLYGLLLFLGYDPYQEKKWWTKLLYEPFANGVTVHLTKVLNNILWRTDKDSVLDQMNIPKQETKLYKLKLSKVERIFYDKILTACRSDFHEKVKKYDCEYSKLKAIDKHILSKILLPLKKVEQACCHFQLTTGSNFANIDRCKMSIPELLDHLLKNAMQECEELHRKKILNLNGLAGTQSLKGLFKESCDTYNKAILSAEENKKFVRTDSFQLIHTLHNYLKTIDAWKESGEEINSIKNFLKCEDIDKFCKDMSDKCSDSCKAYFIKFEENTKNCKSTLIELKGEIKDLCGKTSLNSKRDDKWWINLLNSLSSTERESFIFRLKENFQNIYGELDFLQDSCPSLFSSFSNTSGLIYSLATASEALHEARGNLEKLVLGVLRSPTQSDVVNAAECHLRPIPKQQVSKCIYCKIDDAFKRYESKLFHFNEVPVSDDEPCDEEGKNDKEICFKQLRKGTHTDNEFETCMKFLGNYCNRNRGFLEFVDDAKNDIKLFEIYKKEFKALRNAWLNATEYVAALDELEMAKTSLRLSLPGEKIESSASHIIIPSELERSMWEFESSASYHHSEFKKKLGQLFYLQNLKKAENVNEPFEESCPVCCTTFEGYWTVLQCGHNFCWDCIQVICQRSGIRCCRIRCPVCREETEKKDIYYLEPPSISDTNVKGNYSTKVSALVECLLKIQQKNPKDKSLVFSTWKNLLSILEDSLIANDINYVTLSDKRGVKFQEALDVFKNNDDCTVLLLPLKVGANGLNLVEASHVLIAEPLLNHSQILQAVGRVHRIGQTKETTVHEFVVRNTIEENIHLIHEKDSSSKDNDDSLTVQHLKLLFDSH